MQGIMILLGSSSYADFLATAKPIRPANPAKPRPMPPTIAIPTSPSRKQNNEKHVKCKFRLIVIHAKIIYIQDLWPIPGVFKPCPGGLPALHIFCPSSNPWFNFSAELGVHVQWGRHVKCAVLWASRTGWNLHVDISPDSFVQLLCFSFLVLGDSSQISVFFKPIMWC